MALTGVSPSVNMLHASPQGGRSPALPDTQQPNGAGFGSRLGQAIEDVNAQQTKATQAVRDFETGATQDLAAVMVEQQLSSLGFQMTMQVRNKALQAYRDIMNMPV